MTVCFRKLFHPFIEGEDLVGRAADGLNNGFTIADLLIAHRQH